MFGRRTTQWTILVALFAIGLGLAYSSSSASSANTAINGRSLGIVIPWSSTWQSDLDAFSQKVGGTPAIVGLYRDWTIPLINSSQLDAAISRGAAPQVTWEPWDSTKSTSDPNYALSTIVAGSHDAYIQASAQAAAAYGKPFQLRFAPEMNGSWAPWEGSVNGNTPALYVAAWQHVVSIFRAVGATNVQWVWSPNNGPISTIGSYYPGDSWVDFIGIDGYNWGSSLGNWRSFTQIFGPAYSVVASLSSLKPIQISETASAETGGNKAAWITSAFLSEIPASFPRVIAVIWFDENKETDWRIDSSTSSLAAYQQVVASSLWGGETWPGATTTEPTATDSTSTGSTTPLTAPTTTSSTTTGTTTTVASLSLSTPSMSVSSYGRSSVSLGWSTVSGALGYTVEVSTSSSFSAPTVVTAGGTTTTVTGLQSATAYWFRLRATAGPASSPWSSPASVTTTGKPHR